MPSLFPHITPYKAGYLDVSHGHSLYYECSGNPKGIPVLYLHGGPGGRIKAKHRRLFHPKRFHYIGFDQRGAGKSRPQGSLVHNTTQHLVEDVRALLDMLKIEKTMLFGSSWGSTLALCFALAYPKRVSRMLLSGIFLGTKREHEHFFRGGVAQYYPDAWERLLAQVPRAMKTKPEQFYYKKLTAKNIQERKKYARELVLFECAIGRLEQDVTGLKKIARTKKYFPGAAIEAHYLANNCFIPENYILKNSKKITHIRTTIVQGRYDIVCPPIAAYQLAQHLKNATIHFVTAGHFKEDKEIQKKLLEEIQSIAKKKNISDHGLM